MLGRIVLGVGEFYLWVLEHFAPLPSCSLLLPCLHLLHADLTALDFIILPCSETSKWSEINWMSSSSCGVSGHLQASMRLELCCCLHNLCFTQFDVDNSLFQFSEHNESNNKKNNLKKITAMSTKTFQPCTLLIFVNYAWDYRQYLFSVLLQILSVSHESDFTWWKRKYLREILLPKAEKKSSMVTSKDLGSDNRAPFLSNLN